ncbi:hypothetical protein ACJJTC_002617 [Scirpophaga incertulas]
MNKMMPTLDKEIDIFVTTKIGSFKHIKYHTDATKNNKKCIENLIDVKTLQKEDSITCMSWGNVAQTEILIAKKTQQIDCYDTLQGFTKSVTADFSTGHVVGLGRHKRRLLAALSSGVVKIWGKQEAEMQVGKLDRMRMCADDTTLFATGGEENDLKVWRIGEAEPAFSAKNLPNDWLQLRQPIWVSDLTFLPGSNGQLLAVCSRYGYVRLYDTRAQRRPIANVEFKMAATCIAPSFDDRQVLVGFGRGQLHQVDLRNSRSDKGFKGCAGAVSDVAIARNDRLVVSVSLDRQLRIHSYDTKEMLYRQYLTSKLSCVLVQTESTTPLRKGEVEIKEETEPETLEKEESADEMDVLFDNMETITDKPKKKKAPPEPTESKRVKPSLDGSTESQQDEASQEEAIYNLLRSTEKQKRKREKQKREKRAKSVFYNA